MRRALHRFRTRLALILLAASLAPLALVGGMTLHLAGRYLEETAIGEHERVLDSVAASVELQVAELFARLERLATAPEVQSLERRRFLPVLRRFLDGSAFFVSCTVHSAAGGIASVPGHPVLEQEMSAVVREGRSRALPATAGGGGQYRSRDYLVPIPSFLDPAEVVGVLRGVAVVDGSAIQDLLDAQPVGEGAYVCIIDALGELVASRGAGLPAGARRFEPAAGFADPPVDPGAVRTARVEMPGRVDLVSLAWSPSLGAWIASGRPWDDVFGLVDTLEENLAVVALLALLACFAASLYLSRMVSRPITQLTEGITRLEEGVLSHRLVPESEDELGEACRAFNSLAEMLQKRRMIASVWQKLRQGGPETRP